jgi:hypothetical protein
MAKKWKSIKIDEEVLKLVEKHKQEYGVPVSVFIEKAILKEIKYVYNKK